MSLASSKIAADTDCACSKPLTIEEAIGPSNRGFVRSIDPGVRLFVCCVFCLAVVSLNSVSAAALAVVIGAATATAAGQDLGSSLRRMAALEGFMILVLGMLPFSTQGEALFSVAGWPASREGFLLGLGILLKANAAALMIFALLSSMEPAMLGHAMARLRMPNKFILLFLFTLRYIDVLGREYRRLRVAMRARGFRMGFNLHTWQSIGYLVGMLLARSLERSERIVAAMLCRGYTGTFPVLADTAPLSWRDGAFATLWLGLCLGLVLAGAL